jgi:AraC-like DNA-binding protein/quercetin dioxygenase-like cupin family protein
LADVRQFAPPLEPDSPIWLREIKLSSGAVVPRGETHPCCEMALTLQGEGVEFIEGEQARFTEGDLLLIGPRVPHWVRIDRYPHHGLTVFFLPSMLLELGPLGDGAALLRRFTARQTIRQRLLHLPNGLRTRFETGMRQMWAGFQTRPLGWEMRLRAALTELLLAVVRWEDDQGRAVLDQQLNEDWVKLEHALTYIRRHFAEPIYATDLARAIAVSETRLKILFDRTLGVPWTKFLQGYRVRQAAALLCVPGQSVTEVGLSAGFESLSHFIRVFRKFTGAAPSAYARQQPSPAFNRPMVMAGLSRHLPPASGLAALPQRPLLGQ